MTEQDQFLRSIATRRSQHSNPNRYKNNMTPSHGRTL